MDFWELVALIFCGRGGDGRSPRCDQVATFPWYASYDNATNPPESAEE